ncbi:MAG TPA: zinc-dependent metalloprotease [Polyangia bacterium]|jgi:hypothetical protein|nr:zinc-dependent metalloprotease [Polyangia bacterium]
MDKQRRHFSPITIGSLGVLALPLVLLAGACGGSKDGAQQGVSQNAPFVAVPLTSAEAGRPSGGAQDFYLAINRSQLGQRWFYSTYLKQFFPGAVSSGAARSLGTLVVSFREQNNRLYIYNEGDGKASSDTFDPQLIVDAYPVMDYAPFRQIKGSERYVLFDPASGLNRFSVISDAFAAGGAPDRFSIELSYMQRYREIDDGITFEKVFVGYGELPAGADPTEPNQFRASGTLGIGLRRYKADAGFQPAELPPEEYYFRSEPLQVRNTGEIIQVPVKWNIKPGMKPIRWVISNQFREVQNDPYFSQYDIVAAIKAGIENWNEVFGFKALEAVEATPDQSFADDDVNYLIFDLDPTFGAAFADWRINPNSGEIRGASVYFNSIWLLIGDQIFSDDAGLKAQALAPKARPQLPSITWEPAQQRPLCLLWAPPYRDIDGAPAGASSSRSAALAGLTKKQKVERYLTHVVLHEVGHTLGLRHNFRGSTEPPSNSVMEYVDDFDAPLVDHPQAYDMEAIRYLYGLSQSLPTHPFCTDEDTVADVDCSTFDVGADPLNDSYGPNYEQVADNYLNSRPGSVLPNNSLNGVLKYVRASTDSAQRVTAWSIVSAPVVVGAFTDQVAQNPVLGQRIDTLTRRIFSRMFLDAASLRGDFTADPPIASDARLQAGIVSELRGNLLNTDGFRSYGTRRVCIDVLKRMQVVAAYRTLLEASEALTAQLPSLTGDDALLTEDLIARINRAVSPYYN